MYSSIRNLPKHVRRKLPKPAQEIYREAFNNANKQHWDSSERWDNASFDATSYKMAWSAVKKEYKKGIDGYWKQV